MEKTHIILINFARLSTGQFPSQEKILNCTYSVPSAYQEFKCLKMLKKYRSIFPQSRIDGEQNVWIVKPSFSSRGIGVRCINSIKGAFNRGHKMHPQVVQKYIEKTFLLRHENGELRKFDIRQWVLVTSMSPLVIYMFSSCYFRICGSEFDLRDIDNKYRHISNFSIQKTNPDAIGAHSELVMSVAQFVEYLGKHCNIHLNWERDMFPKLAKIVRETLNSATDVIEQKPCCFELYGFDFVLDNKLEPWLIEVNLSPACCERTNWLVEMLHHMSDGLVDLIEPKLPFMTERAITLNSEHSWIKICDTTQPSFFSPSTTDIDIIGRPLSMKYEAKIEKVFSIQHALRVIKKYLPLLLAWTKVRSLRRLIHH